MSDFLGRLAARTLGVAPVAQPMGRTIFAPSGGSEQPNWIQEAATEISETVDAVESQSAATRELAGNPRSRPSSPPPADFSVVAPPAGVPALGPLELSEETVAPSVREAEGRSIKPQVKREPPTAREGTRIAPRDSSEPPPVATAFQASPAALLDPKREPAATHLLVPRGMAQRESAQAASFSHGSANNGPGVAPHGRASAATAAPIIRVSIGRVEVRAEFPPAAARPSAQRAQPPTLSVEEYARQRHEGKR